MIRFAMRAILQEARKKGREGVSVPKRSKSKPCTWRRCGGPYVWIGFETMLEVLDFSLDQAIIPKASSLGSMLKTEDPRLEIYL